MGQYLTIGVATKISVNKERAKRQASASPEKIKEALELNYNKSGIYTVEETEDNVLLTLRPEIAEAELNIDSLSRWLDRLFDYACRTNPSKC